MSQNEIILSMLRDGPVTALEALRGAHCLRLAARIDDLRKRGYNIVTQRVSINGKQIAKYFLIEGKK